MAVIVAGVKKGVGFALLSGLTGLIKILEVSDDWMFLMTCVQPEKCLLYQQYANGTKHETPEIALRGLFYRCCC